MYVLLFESNNQNIIAYFQCKKLDVLEVLLLYLSNVFQGVLSHKLLGFCVFNSFI